MIAVTARDRQVSAPVHVPYAFRTRSVRVPLVFATRSVFLLIEDLLGGPSGHQKYGTCYKYQRNAYGTRTARVRNAYGTRPECTGLRWYHSLASLSTSLATTPAHAHVLAHMRCLEGRALNAATVSLPCLSCSSIRLWVSVQSGIILWRELKGIPRQIHRRDARCPSLLLAPTHARNASTVGAMRRLFFTRVVGNKRPLFPPSPPTAMLSCPPKAQRGSRRSGEQTTLKLGVRGQQADNKKQETGHPLKKTKRNFQWSRRGGKTKEYTRHRCASKRPHLRAVVFFPRPGSMLIIQ